MSGGYSNGGYTASANVSASQTKMDSHYQSVDKQTGIYAGDGGFDVTTQHHTQLNGAVIASTAADTSKNKIDTGTLGFKDIKNEADFHVSQQSAGFNTGGSIGGQFVSNATSSLIENGAHQDEAKSTTHAAVDSGQIIIRDKDNQKQDVLSSRHLMRFQSQVYS
ncbi:hypothetical protein PT273_00405 [Orbaceae bacterium ESL0727]|nr:hypothetical protein [Orbaceae bacterium ESL0727]